MRSLVNAYVERILHDRRERLKFGGIVLLLAVIVVGIVFWRLSYVGVAMTNEVYCGLEEHTHDRSCYTEILTCGLEESEGTEGHTHDSSCYETVTELVCGLEESAGHIHDDACFDEDSNLTCAIPESEGHVHNESCYETTWVLVCGLEETPAAAGHTHTSECYTQVLTCGLEEHVHTMACMIDETADLETERDWEATLPEEEELTGNWNEDIVLIAESQIGYTESERNFQLSDDGMTRNGYTRYGKWYGNEYGAWDAMFVSFCLNYAGVSEEEFPFFPYNSGAYAWTVELEKKDFYEDAEDHIPVPGDIVFLDTDEDDKADTVAIVAEVLTNRNGDVTVLKVIQGNHEDAVAEYTIALTDEGILGYGVIPEQPEEEEAAAADSTMTIVADMDLTDGYVPAEDAEATSGSETKEGYDDASSEMNEEDANASDEMEETADASDEIEEDAEASSEIAVLSAEAEIVYTAEDGGVLVTVTAPADALPEEAELVVTLYGEDSEEYADAAEVIGYSAAVDTLSAEEDDADGPDEESAAGGMVAMDVSFLLDGEEVEPSEPVEITMDLSAILPEYAKGVTVKHLAETEDGGIEPEIVAIVSAEEPVAEFEVENFSMFTVDWGDGSSMTVYVYDMDGNGIDEVLDAAFSGSSSSISISDLVSHLIDNPDHANGMAEYTFQYATVMYENSSGGGYSITEVGSSSNSVASVSKSGTTYTVSYGNTSTNVSNPSEIWINLYFSCPTVELTATNEHTDTVTLTADAEYFQHTTATGATGLTYEWSVDDESLGTLTTNDSGATFAWSSSAADGSEVTITVTVTNTYTDGNGVTQTETATDSYTLRKGEVEYTVQVNTGSSGNTGLGYACVALVDSNGNTVATGVADSTGKATLWAPSGDYTVEVTYVAIGGGNGSRYEGSGTVNSSSRSATVYVGSSISSSADGYYEHIDVKIAVAVPTTEQTVSVTEDFVRLDSVLVYDQWGSLILTCDGEGLVHNPTTDDYNCLFTNEGYAGNYGHGVVISGTDTVVITYEVLVETTYYQYHYEYVLDNDGNYVCDEETGERQRVLVLDTDGDGNYITWTQTETVTESVTITKDDEYPDGTYYPYDEINAYQLYNMVYGTSLTEEQFTSMAGAGTLQDFNSYGVNISGLTYVAVAAALCDTASSANQAGLDYAIEFTPLDLPELELSITKYYADYPYESNGVPTEVFTFDLMEAIIDENTGIWSAGTLTDTGSTGAWVEYDPFPDNNGVYIFTSKVTLSTGVYTFYSSTDNYYIITEEADPEVNAIPSVDAYGLHIVLEMNLQTGIQIAKVEFIALQLNEDGTYSPADVAYDEVFNQYGEFLADDDENPLVSFVVDEDGYPMQKTTNQDGQEYLVCVNDKGDTVLIYYSDGVYKDTNGNTLQAVYAVDDYGDETYITSYVYEGTNGNTLYPVYVADWVDQTNNYQAVEGSTTDRVYSVGFVNVYQENSVDIVKFTGTLTGTANVSSHSSVETWYLWRSNGGAAWTGGQVLEVCTGFDSSGSPQWGSTEDPLEMAISDGTFTVKGLEAGYTYYLSSSSTANDLKADDTTNVKLSLSTDNVLEGAEFTISRVADDVDPSSGDELETTHIEYAYFTMSDAGNYTLQGWYITDGSALSDDLLVNPEDEDPVYPEGATFFLETASDGMIHLLEMESGDYMLTEVKPPAGYLALTEPIYFTLSNNGTDTAVVLDKEDVGVENIPGDELPVTGGIGYGAFAAVGLLLIACAGTALAIVNRKRKGEKA